VASRYEGDPRVPSVAHHLIPFPHRGRYGNPDGFLCFADALERSCNVYFETVADRLGMDRLCKWYDRFGLGHETGVGIAESTGRLPNSYPDAGAQQRSILWFSGIGQTRMLATPIQMANVAATVARNGIWMRPRLVGPGVATTPMKYKNDRHIPDRVDLQLSPESLAAAREGMVNVVNAPSGTGTEGHMDELLVAGKTGTAQASRLRPKELIDGVEQRVELQPASWGHPTDTPWYRGVGANGDKLNHAWFIGFAPANDPQIAFAVMLQYGGGGGTNAGPIAKRILIACAEHGYLTLGKSQ
jgi:penicillin-binding protein 2